KTGLMVDSFEVHQLLELLNDDSTIGQRRPLQDRMEESLHHDAYGRVAVDQLLEWWFSQSTFLTSAQYIAAANKGASQPPPESDDPEQVISEDSTVAPLTIPPHVLVSHAPNQDELDQVGEAEWQTEEADSASTNESDASDGAQSASLSKGMGETQPDEEDTSKPTAGGSLYSREVVMPQSERASSPQAGMERASREGAGEGLHPHARAEAGVKQLPSSSSLPVAVAKEESILEETSSNIPLAKAKESTTAEASPQAKTGTSWAKATVVETASALAAKRLSVTESANPLMDEWHREEGAAANVGHELMGTAEGSTTVDAPGSGLDAKLGGGGATLVDGSVHEKISVESNARAAGMSLAAEDASTGTSAASQVESKGQETLETQARHIDVMDNLDKGGDERIPLAAPLKVDGKRIVEGGEKGDQMVLIDEDAAEDAAGWVAPDRSGMAELDFGAKETLTVKQAEAEETMLKAKGIGKRETTGDAGKVDQMTSVSGNVIGVGPPQAREGAHTSEETKLAERASLVAAMESFGKGLNEEAGKGRQANEDEFESSERAKHSGEAYNVDGPSRNDVSRKFESSEADERDILAARVDKALLVENSAIRRGKSIGGEEEALAGQTIDADRQQFPKERASVKDSAVDEASSMADRAVPDLGTKTQVILDATNPVAAADATESGEDQTNAVAESESIETAEGVSNDTAEGVSKVTGGGGTKAAAGFVRSLLDWGGVGSPVDVEGKETETDTASAMAKAEDARAIELETPSAGSMQDLREVDSTSMLAADRREAVQLNAALTDVNPSSTAADDEEAVSIASSQMGSGPSDVAAAENRADGAEEPRYVDDVAAVKADGYTATPFTADAANIAAVTADGDYSSAVMAPVERASADAADVVSVDLPATTADAHSAPAIPPHGENAPAVTTAADDGAAAFSDGDDAPPVTAGVEDDSAVTTVGVLAEAGTADLDDSSGSNVREAVVVVSSEADEKEETPTTPQGEKASEKEGMMARESGGEVAASSGNAHAWAASTNAKANAGAEASTVLAAEAAIEEGHEDGPSLEGEGMESGAKHDRSDGLRQLNLNGAPLPADYREGEATDAKEESYPSEMEGASLSRVGLTASGGIAFALAADVTETAAQKTPQADGNGVVVASDGEAVARDAGMAVSGAWALASDAGVPSDGGDAASDGGAVAIGKAGQAALPSEAAARKEVGESALAGVAPSFSFDSGRLFRFTGLAIVAICCFLVFLSYPDAQLIVAAAIARSLLSPALRPTHEPLHQPHTASTCLPDAPSRCTPLCGFLNQAALVVAEFQWLPVDAGEWSKRSIASFAEALALLLALRFYVSSTTSPRQGHLFVTLVVLVVVEALSNDQLPSPVNGCAVGQALLPLLSVLCLALLKSNLPMLTALLFGVVLAIEPTLLLLLPLVACHLIGKAGFSRALLILASLAQMPLLSIIPFFSDSQSMSAACSSLTRDALARVMSTCSGVPDHTADGSIWGLYALAGPHLGGETYPAQRVATEHLLGRTVAWMLALVLTLAVPPITVPGVEGLWETHRLVGCAAVLVMMAMPLYRGLMQAHHSRLLAAAVFYGIALMLFFPESKRVMQPMLDMALCLISPETRGLARVRLLLGYSAAAQHIRHAASHAPLDVAFALTHLVLQLLLTALPHFCLDNYLASITTPSYSSTSSLRTPGERRTMRSLFPSLWRLPLALHAFHVFIAIYPTPNDEGEAHAVGALREWLGVLNPLLTLALSLLVVGMSHRGGFESGKMLNASPGLEAEGEGGLTEPSADKELRVATLEEALTRAREEIDELRRRPPSQPQQEVELLRASLASAQAEAADAQAQCARMQLEMQQAYEAAQAAAQASTHPASPHYSQYSQEQQVAFEGAGQYAQPSYEQQYAQHHSPYDTASCVDELSREHTQSQDELLNEQQPYSTDSPYQQQPYSADLPYEQQTYSTDLPYEQQTYSTDLPYEQQQYSADMPFEQQQYSADLPYEQRQYSAELPYEHQQPYSDLPYEHQPDSSDLLYEHKQQYSTGLQNEHSQLPQDDGTALPRGNHDTSYEQPPNREQATYEGAAEAATYDPTEAQRNAVTHGAQPQVAASYDMWSQYSGYDASLSGADREEETEKEPSQLNESGIPLHQNVDSARPCDGAFSRPSSVPSKPSSRRPSDGIGSAHSKPSSRRSSDEAPSTGGLAAADSSRLTTDGPGAALPSNAAGWASQDENVGWSPQEATESLMTPPRRAPAPCHHSTPIGGATITAPVVGLVPGVHGVLPQYCTPQVQVKTSHQWADENVQSADHQGPALEQRSTTPRRKVLNSVVPFDSQGRAVSPRRSPRATPRRAYPEAPAFR
ncbi:MAG: hypothetical protein SGPRY_000642, partial [Prymnesium sp.]